MALAAVAVQAAPREEDLNALRERIQALDRKLHDKEASRREARDALRQSEQAISEANRGLAGLETERRALNLQAAELESRRRALERSLTERQAAMARMLAARHAAGPPEALRIALSGHDPSALTRTLYYAGHVSRAAAEVVSRYRAGLTQLGAMTREAAVRAERIQALENRQRLDRERVIAERRERRRVFERLAGEIRRDRREIKVLRADEARLARLVEEIGRVLAKRAPPAGAVERAPQASALPERFSALRGRLRLPVPGELIGRFGAPRGAAGNEAKGVFIRAQDGEAVRSVGAGQVVYADWMRGFGNLLIIDHGEAYLSIYANNESLLRQVGDRVMRGETIATTGASGGNEETGLYFELRHLGKAFDPLSWVRRK